MLILRLDDAQTLLSSMMDLQDWAEYVLEWVTKDPYSFLIAVTLALVPIFIASAAVSQILAKIIEEYRKQKMQQDHQENMFNRKIIKTE